MIYKKTFDLNDNQLDLVNGGNGGGIQISNGDMFMNPGGTISKNPTNGSGGGVQISNDDMFMNPGTIGEKSTNGSSGGVQISNDSMP